jgi:tetratricopeptide (TPR) repeat protein
MRADFNRQADDFIVAGRYAEAQALLEVAIRAMPNGWTPRRNEGEFLTIAFWNQKEFLAFSYHEVDRLTKSVFWVNESYSRAWYQLAFAHSKQDHFEEALFAIDCGLELENDHPELWSAKGHLLGRLKRHQEALDCYTHAASLRDWAPARQVAHALRGQGVQLVDLNRLDEAEAALQRSLELEPDSEVARNALGYIADLRSQREAKKKETPWFLHSFAKPPTDPLTVQLLALVEGMPSIPGPKTVGSENYSRIVDAFMKRGWEGFEEVFDRIVKRDRPDYADVKRDLLCEPLFSIKAHKSLAELVLGRKTIDEIWEENREDNGREPQ